MTRRLVIALLVLAASARIASAGLPPPPNPELPCGIILVCTNGSGTADPAGAFTITVRDAAGNPSVGDVIALEFAGCPDISLCSHQPDPSVQVQCSPGVRRVLGVSNGAGQVHMNLVGGVAHRTPGSPAGCVNVYVDGLLMRTGIHVAAMVETDGDGLNTTDLALWLTDYYEGGNAERSDYDYRALCATGVSSPDLAMWLASYFGGYVAGCAGTGGMLCP